MSKPRCKYDLARLKQMAQEDSVLDLLIKIDPSAIGDPVIQKHWKAMHDAWNQLEELLEP